MSHILAVIPARGGSKRIPGKNIKRLGDKPLIAHTINTARRVSHIKDIIVSTEDPAIADVAKAYGASVPFFRSEEFATDTANIEGALIEIINKQQKINVHYDAVLLLQPTSPFRSLETIEQSIALYERDPANSVIAVSHCKSHPHWCKTIDADGVLHAYMQGLTTFSHKQLLPPVFEVNGLIYIVPVEHLLEHGNLYTEQTKAYTVDAPIETLDIDTPFDWEIAEYFLTKYIVNQEKELA